MPQSCCKKERVDEHTVTRRQGKHSPIEVIEERNKVEAKFYEAFLLVYSQRPEDLCRVVHVVRVYHSNVVQNGV